MKQTDAAATTIDGYLDRLAAELRLGPQRNRRVLGEAEDHLRTAAAAAVAGGATEAEAEQQAISLFGPPRLVARRFVREQGRVLPPSLLLNLVLALGLLGGAGLVGVGVSGAISQVMGMTFGKTFVAGDTNGVTYTPARCHDFESYFPQAPDCEAAATAHHFEEVVDYRIAAGVLGLLVLTGYAAIRYRFRRLSGVRVLPDGFVPIAGAALFGVAACLLLLQSVGQLLLDPTGTGGLLSGGIVSAALFLYFAGQLLQQLRRPAEVEG